MSNQMYRVTTPTHTFTLPLSTDDYSVIMVTYKQADTTLTKAYQGGSLPSGMTLDNNKVILKLTQEETKAFESGNAEVQIRVLTNEGDADASDPIKIVINDVFNEDILG